ncbi:hypothetical protein F4677DRAFT_436294 [Hypoxylon crocopeplum]|nr:hypothetical protein F4677DRAFT_436294 [Hypoxylon crocopeplum]
MRKSEMMMMMMMMMIMMIMIMMIMFKSGCSKLTLKSETPLLFFVLEAVTVCSALPTLLVAV